MTTARLTVKDLPDAGEGRWWRVRLNTKSNAKPIQVQLMESQAEGRRALSRVLSWENCIAGKKPVLATAEIILARVADYALVIGEYGGEGGSSSTFGGSLDGR